MHSIGKKSEKTTPINFFFHLQKRPVRKKYEEKKSDTELIRFEATGHLVDTVGHIGCRYYTLTPRLDTKKNFGSWFGTRFAIH